MSRGQIVTAASLTEYFREALDAALKHEALHPNEATSSYLVQLLCEFAENKTQDLKQPLAMILARANFSSSTEESVSRLKQVGDQSLYVAGFFGESLVRLKLDLEYYVTMGEVAYRRLSSLMKRLSEESRLTVVFTELGRKFPNFVQVLSEVKHQGGFDFSMEDLGELYQEWQKTGSKTIAAKLKALGMVLPSKKTSD